MAPSDGSKLRESWSNALKDAQIRFRALLASSSSARDWKPVPFRPKESTLPASLPHQTGSPGFDATFNSKDSPNVELPDLAEVIMHKKSSKDGDVIRAVLDLPLGPILDSGAGSLDAWRAVLATPELRKEYDPAVQDGRILEMFDPQTRISKTDFALGWPANPRDAVTISRSYADSSTLIDICASLPRSTDEPGYLRPAPPFVRSHIHLFAWCIQLTQWPAEGPSRQTLRKVRITCFWQHDLKAIWGLGNSIQQHLPDMLVGIVRTVQTYGSRMSHMTGYGRCVGIGHVDFQNPRQLLTLEYSISSDEDEDDTQRDMFHGELQGPDDLHSLREYRRLERSIECSLPNSQNWDVRVHTRASTSPAVTPQWIVYASQPASFEDLSTVLITLRISHPSPPKNSVLKVTLSIEPSASLGARTSSSTLRVNGSSQAIHYVELRDPASSNSVLPTTIPSPSQRLLEDASTIGDMNLRSASSAASIASTVSTSSDRTGRNTTGGAASSRPSIPGVPLTRLPAAEKAILTLVRRNYIYFSSLLQEPEAKWSSPITEARGVTVTRLNSIDPTLVVYRAESVFVGIGVWDLLSTVATPGVGSYWNKGHEEPVHLEHVNELTHLWHLKTRATWPVNARDSVQLKTTYKSPTACHVFSFSTDDIVLFPTIPPTSIGVIRTQVDLQGFAIEALSPNTTLLTLLDQSDPKGWSNKSSIPSQMIAAVAGLGEFAIKCGGPPMATRILGAKIVGSRYDHERNIFRLDYETNSVLAPKDMSSVVTLSSSPTRSNSLLSDKTASTDYLERTPQPATAELPETFENASVRSKSSTASPSNINFNASSVECELRCDIDTWASSLDVIVDPAPQNLTCLKRHKLASGGGGLWLTVEHDMNKVADERITIVVRKGGGGAKDRGAVVVNAVKIRVDVEDLAEHEVKLLSKTRRIKPTRIPLDQPPVSTVRRRGTENDEDADLSGESFPPRGRWAFVAPISRLFTLAADQVATTAASASTALGTTGPAVSPSPDSRSPMHCAFEGLSRVRELHVQSMSDGWVLVNEKEIPVYSKIDGRISSKVPIHRGQRIIEGYGAEEIAAVISESACRIQWDDRIDSVLPLDSYGSGCRTTFVVAKAGFPFRDRGFYTASLVARILPDVPAVPEIVRSRTLSMTSNSGRGRSPPEKSRPPALFCISSSYATVTPRGYSHQKINPFTLPIGQVLLEGWILETLDPYTSENLAIPSTRCTLITAIDLAGSVPLGYTISHNASNVRAILSLERYLKGKNPSPYPVIPAPTLTVDEIEGGEVSRSDGQLLSWEITGNDSEHQLVTSSFGPEDNIYRLTVLLKPSALPGGALVRTPSPNQISSIDRHPTVPERAISRPGTPSKEIEATQTAHHRSFSRATASSSSYPLIPSPRGRTMSTTATPSLGLGERSSTDFVACEIVFDSSFYKRGCIVHLTSRILPTESDSSKGTPVNLSPLPSVPSEIPVLYSVHSLPPATLASNSLSSPTNRYLLRISIPSARYDAPPLQDPLTGKLRKPPAKPPWLYGLEERGAILDVIVKQANERKFALFVDEVKIFPNNLKPSTSSVFRDNLESMRLDKWPALKRVTFDPDAVGAMERPIASASHLLEEFSPATLSLLEQKPMLSDDQSVAEISPGDTPLGSRTPTTDLPGSGLLGFLGQYRRSSGPTIPLKPNEGGYWSANGPLAIPGRWLSRSTSSTTLENPPKPSSNGHTTKAIAEARRPIVVSLPAVIFITLIAFLLGSLLRSVLSPADFVLLDGQQRRGRPEWLEVKRLMHFHLFGVGIMLGVVRRAPL